MSQKTRKESRTAFIHTVTHTAYIVQCHSEKKKGENVRQLKFARNDNIRIDVRKRGYSANVQIQRTLNAIRMKSRKRREWA